MHVCTKEIVYLPPVYAFQSGLALQALGQHQCVLVLSVNRHDVQIARSTFGERAFV